MTSKEIKETLNESEVEIIFNGGKKITLKNSDYLLNKDYWDKQQAIIEVKETPKESNSVEEFLSNKSEFIEDYIAENGYPMHDLSRVNECLTICGIESLLKYLLKEYTQ